MLEAGHVENRARFRRFRATFSNRSWSGPRGLAERERADDAKDVWAPFCSSLIFMVLDHLRLALADENASPREDPVLAVHLAVESKHRTEASAEPDRDLERLAGAGRALEGQLLDPGEIAAPARLGVAALEQERRLGDRFREEQRALPALAHGRACVAPSRGSEPVPSWNRRHPAAAHTVSTNRNGYACGNAAVVIRPSSSAR